jgi:DNA-binding beta-propeller fold protein YncE
MNTRFLLIASLALLGCASADDVDEIPAGLPILGQGSNDLAAVNVDVVADGSDDLLTPRDLDFHPSTGDLWIVNQADESVTILTNPGTDSQKSLYRHSDNGAAHFLGNPSGIAFGDNNMMATAQDTDLPTQGNATPADFMGPTMWTAKKGDFDGGHASHMDMLHHSPLGKGIAHEQDNVYWYYDGAHEALTRYDFNDDHGLAGADHSDGDVSVWVTGKMSPAKDGTPSHLVYDPDTELLYVADTGANRIVVLDTNSGNRGDDTSPNYDGGDQYEQKNGDMWTLVEGEDVGLEAPSGVALHDGMLFVSDAGNPAIYAFDLQGEMVDFIELSSQVNGIAFAPDGSLYYVDPDADEVVRIAAP